MSNKAVSQEQLEKIEIALKASNSAGLCDRGDTRKYYRMAMSIRNCETALPEHHVFFGEPEKWFQSNTSHWPQSDFNSHTIERYIECAQQCQTSGDFKDKFPSEYRTANKRRYETKRRNIPMLLYLAEVADWAPCYRTSREALSLLPNFNQLSELPPGLKSTLNESKGFWGAYEVARYYFSLRKEIHRLETIFAHMGDAMNFNTSTEWKTAQGGKFNKGYWFINRHRNVISGVDLFDLATLELRTKHQTPPDSIYLMIGRTEGCLTYVKVGITSEANYEVRFKSLRNKYKNFSFEIAYLLKLPDYTKSQLQRLETDFHKIGALPDKSMLTQEKTEVRLVTARELKELKCRFEQLATTPNVTIFVDGRCN